jgi:hypothetical protein
MASKRKKPKKTVTNPVMDLIMTNPKVRRAIVAACEEAGQPLTSQAVFDWKNRLGGVPAKRAAIVARVLGLSLHQVRPDVFPAD